MKAEASMWVEWGGAWKREMGIEWGKLLLLYLSRFLCVESAVRSRVCSFFSRVCDLMLVSRMEEEIRDSFLAVSFSLQNLPQPWSESHYKIYPCKKKKQFWPINGFLGYLRFNLIRLLLSFLFFFDIQDCFLFKQSFVMWKNI